MGQNPGGKMVVMRLMRFIRVRAIPAKLKSLLLAGVVTAAGAGISAGLGVAHVPLWALVIATIVVTFVIFCIGNYLTGEVIDKGRWLGLGLIAESLLLIMVFGYHQLYDRAPTTYSLTVRTDTNHPAASTH
jgi:drug/metabolite transporter (DMT)-like permease